MAATLCLGLEYFERQLSGKQLERMNSCFVLRTVSGIADGFRLSAIADGYSRLDSINFERPLRGSQFEKLTDYNVPIPEVRRCVLT